MPPNISDLDQRVRELACAALEGKIDEIEARKQIAWHMYSAGEAERATDFYLQSRPSIRHLREDIVNHCLTYIFTAVTGLCGTDEETGQAEGLAEHGTGLFYRMSNDGAKFDLVTCSRGNSPQGWLRRILPKVIQGSIVQHLSTVGGYISPHSPSVRADENDMPCIFESHLRFADAPAEDEALAKADESAYSDAALAVIEGAVFDKSEEVKALVFGRVIREDILGGLPALERPIDSALRRKMHDLVTSDRSAAITAITRPHDNALADLWSTFSRDDVQRLLASQYATEYATVIAREALVDLPRPSRGVITRVEKRLVGMLGKHNVNASVACAIVSLFMDGEYTTFAYKNRRSRNSDEREQASPYQWTSLVQTLDLPDEVFPSDLHEARRKLFGIVEEYTEMERIRVERKGEARRQRKARARAKEFSEFDVDGADSVNGACAWSTL